MTRWQDWAHVILSTRGSWLPGDPRGFRDHDHRSHSSGDYRNPPPTGEHASLLRHAKRVVHREVVLAPEICERLVPAFIAKLDAMSLPVRVMALGRVHGHVLVRPGLADVKKLIARAKQASSQSVHDVFPGSIWAQGCHVVRIRDEGHYRATVSYIERHRDEGACVWVHPRWNETNSG